MMTIKLQATLAAVLCSFACCAVLSTYAAQVPPDPLSPAPLNSIESAPRPRSFVPDLPDPQRVARAQQIETFKMDGLTGNTTHIPDMIAALKETEPIEKQYTAWLALSRLGAVAAVPAMNASLKLVYYSPNTDLGEFARACRARLLAQTESMPHAMAVRYFQEIGETPEQLNTAVEQHIHKMHEAPITHIMPQAIYKDRYAVEELADMIYHGPAAELLADPLIAQVDFSLCPDADYKIKLALLTPEQQRKQLVEWLAEYQETRTANTVLIKEEDTFAIGQLLIDLGRPEAMEAITDKLEEVDKNNQSYKPKTYWKLLFVLYVCGDHYQSPIWSHLPHYPSPKVVAAGIGQEQNQLRSGY